MLISSTSLVGIWLNWAVFVGVLISALAAFWVFFDAARQFIPAAIWKILAGLGFVLIVPGLVIRFMSDQFGCALGFCAVTSLAQTLAFIGIGGLVLSLVAVVGYAMTRSQGAGTYAGSTMPMTPPPSPSVAPPPPRPSAPPAPTTPAAPPRPAQQQAPRHEPTQPIDAPAQPVGWLVARSGSRSGQSYGLKQGNNTVGRDSSRADIVLDDPTVSGEHARVRFEGGQFYLYDLASSNGTFVNGRRTQRQMLMDNDVVRFGEAELVFKKA